MSIMFVAALMMAQAPAAAQPEPLQPTHVKKQKPAQVCEYIELTGSRAKRRVCHDVNGNLDVDPGMSHNLNGGGLSETVSTSAPSQASPR